MSFIFYKWSKVQLIIQLQKLRRVLLKVWDVMEVDKQYYSIRMKSLVFQYSACFLAVMWFCCFCYSFFLFCFVGGDCMVFWNHFFFVSYTRNRSYLSRCCVYGKCLFVRWMVYRHYGSMKVIQFKVTNHEKWTQKTAKRNITFVNTVWGHTVWMYRVLYSREYSTDITRKLLSL